jgi:hypothetical protein
MVSRALQMLVLVGVACLLVGQGQAASPSPLEPVPNGIVPRCAPVVARALQRVTIPLTVQALVALTQLRFQGQSINIFEVYNNDQTLEQYLDFLRAQPARGRCIELIAAINGLIEGENQDCVQYMSSLLAYEHEAVLVAEIVPQLPAEAALVCILLRQAISQE